MKFALSALLIFSSPIFAANTEDAYTGPRHMIFEIDGVPHNIFVKAQRNGLFKGFRQSSKMISTFPSLSQYAWSRIMKTGWNKGYQNAFVHPDTLERVQNPFKSGNYSTIPTRPDYIIHNKLIKGMAYVMSAKFTFKHELKGVREAVLASNTPRIFQAETGATDPATHLHGEAGCMEQLEMTSHLFDELREEHLKKFGEPLEITIVSDHGNTLINSKLPKIEKVLEEHGFNMAGKLESPNDVIDISVGLLSSAAFWTLPERRRELAEVLATQPFTDIVAYKNLTTNEFVALGHSGETRFIYDEKIDSFLLTSIKGMDSLALNIPVNRWLTHQEELNITTQTAHPNALYRIYEGLSHGVVHPAAILVSLQPGYEHGHQWTMKLTSKLKRHRSGTHGGLLMQDSIGILASTYFEYPEWVEAHRVPDMIPGFYKEQRYAPVTVHARSDGELIVRLGQAALDMKEASSISVQLFRRRPESKSYDSIVSTFEGKTADEFFHMARKTRLSEERYLDITGFMKLKPGERYLLKVTVMNGSGDRLAQSKLYFTSKNYTTNQYAEFD